MVDWSLAVTAPNAERLVSDDLARLSYPHIFFKRRSTAVQRGRVVDCFPPAFPRYIFVTAAQCWDVVRDVGKVLGLVTFGEEIGVVPERVVDQLLRRCGGGDVLPPEPLAEPFRRGDRVVVGGCGPVAGHWATYDALAEGGRVRLCFDWMGRIIPIEIDIRDVSVVTTKGERKRKRPRRRKRHSSHGS